MDQEGTNKPEKKVIILFAVIKQQGDMIYKQAVTWLCLF